MLTGLGVWEKDAKKLDHLSSNLMGADHVSNGLMEDVFKVWRRKVRTSEKVA